MNSGKLYIVATPIGNLEDITFRAVRILKEVDLILAEDTRVTRKLLGNFGIATPLESYHHHSRDDKKAWILSQILLGKNVALVTDAGTPGISDPGNELIDYLQSQLSPSNFLEDPEDLVARNSAVANRFRLEITPVPGPSALTAALSISGMNVNKFVFLGFMPKKGRTKLFSWLKEGGVPFAFYESAPRLIKTLNAMSTEFPERKLIVARELTKLHESVYRGSFVEVLDQLAKSTLKGEVVVVVDA